MLTDATLLKVGMQPLLAAAGQRCPQVQRRKMPARPEYRGSRISQQRMLMAWCEVGISQVQLNADDTGLGDVLDQASLPGSDGLADELFQTVTDPREHPLVEQGRN